MERDATGTDFRYRLYGFEIRSSWQLNAPLVGHGELGKIDLLEARNAEFVRELQGSIDSQRWTWFEHAMLQDGARYLRWSDLFEFIIVAGGRRILFRQLPGGWREALETYLLGQALSFALLEQHVEPLHASVVVVEDRAVGFLGDSGYGKSSLAATFVHAGYPVLTDDLLVVREKLGKQVAYPGPSRIKLYPEVARALLGEDVRGVQLNDLTPKLIIPLSEAQSANAAFRLQALYVLESPHPARSSRDVRIRTPSSRRAFIELLKNTFNSAVSDSGRLQQQFSFASRLASQVSIKMLSYPRELGIMSRVRDTILADLSS